MVSTYFVTFRIAQGTINGATYEERRRSVVENTRKETGGYWDETTSFIITESSLDTNAFAERASRGLSENADLLVAIDPSDMSMAVFGDVEDYDVLASFFRHAKLISKA